MAAIPTVPEKDQMEFRTRLLLWNSAMVLLSSVFNPLSILLNQSILEQTAYMQPSYTSRPLQYNTVFCIGLLYFAISLWNKHKQNIFLPQGEPGQDTVSGETKRTLRIIIVCAVMALVPTAVCWALVLFTPRINNLPIREILPLIIGPFVLCAVCSAIIAWLASRLRRRYLLWQTWHVTLQAIAEEKEKQQKTE